MYTATTKRATHNLQDELQYSGNPANRSPASEHLFDVFTGDTTKTTEFCPEQIELKLKDIQPQSQDEVLKANLNNSFLPYTASATEKVTQEATSHLKRNQRRNLIQKIQQSINKVKRQKFQGPELEHLKYKLENVDISTNTYIQITSQLIPIDEKVYHLTLGIITTPHPNIQDAEELIEFQLGLRSQQHVCSWKRRLRGTIVTSVYGVHIKYRDDIVSAVKQAK